jgi:hypothetical protein
MTLEEGQYRLIQFVEKEIAQSGLWIFFKRDIEVSLTRILDPFEKTSNLPLPEKIRISVLEFDKRGINCNEEDFLEWEKICATAIKSERLRHNYSGEAYRKHLLLILHSGQIIQFLLGDISHLKGLLGHYIELYKLENSSEK